MRQRPPLIAPSKTGRGLDRPEYIAEPLREAHGSDLTPALNNALSVELRQARQAPSSKGKRLNLLYGTCGLDQAAADPIHVNDPGLVTRDYAYWVENELRKRFNLTGVPVSIDFVKRS